MQNTLGFEQTSYPNNLSHLSV